MAVFFVGLQSFQKVGKCRHFSFYFLFERKLALFHNGNPFVYLKYTCFLFERKSHWFYIGIRLGGGRWVDGEGGPTQVAPVLRLKLHSRWPLLSAETWQVIDGWGNLLSDKWQNHNWEALKSAAIVRQTRTKSREQETAEGEKLAAGGKICLHVKKVIGEWRQRDCWRGEIGRGWENLSSRKKRNLWVKTSYHWVTTRDCWRGEIGRGWENLSPRKKRDLWVKTSYHWVTENG